MKRVMIFGCPGAGKSHTARQLASITGLPLIHLDWHHWQPGWQRMPPKPWSDRVTQLANQKSWIIDGQYSSTLPIRMARADTALYLNFPIYLCVYRVLKRALLGYGKPRGTEFKTGTVEKLDAQLIWYTLNYARFQRHKDLKLLDAFSGTKHIFNSPQSLAQFLNSL